MAKKNLSIYLIKEELTEFLDIIDEGVNELHKYDDNSIAYYSDSFVKEPDWLFNFFNLHNANLKTANSRVLFLKRVNIDSNNTRIFAITFGYGKTLLKEDVCEEQFGLKIVLNTIDRNKIRKISKTDIGKNYKQSQEQMPKESDIGEFGFDVDRDLIKYVTGKSEDENFGKSIISGGDIFNLYIDKDISNIEEFLKYCYSKYMLTTYRTNFEWLDNIKLVRDKILIEKLNNKVVELLNNRDFSQVWLAIPEIINWERVKCIYIAGQQNRNEEYNDIDNNVFVDSFHNQKINDFEQIKQKSISVKSIDDQTVEMARWSAAKCLVGSVELDKIVYAINGGSWYKINNDFVEEINTAYNNLTLSNLEFIDCPKNFNEDEYNQLFVEKIKGSHLIHKYNIPYGGGRGNTIEPCDIAINKTLIHIKNNGGSSYLSHLFNQATNSCLALKDNSFRIKFYNKLKLNKIEDLLEEDRFDVSQYTVVLGIINEHTEERPHIPFFSKVSIKYASQQIRNLGYKFAIKNIKKV